MTLEKEDSPHGHSSVCASSNWEALRFRKLVLRWSDAVTDSAIDPFSGENPIEFTHSLELIDESTGMTSLVESSVRNLRDSTLDSHEVHLENLQPWLDALLTALGYSPTLSSWIAVCKDLRLTSFLPK